MLYRLILALAIFPLSFKDSLPQPDFLPDSDAHPRIERHSAKSLAPGACKILLTLVTRSAKRLPGGTLPLPLVAYYFDE